MRSVGWIAAAGLALAVGAAVAQGGGEAQDGGEEFFHAEGWIVSYSAPTDGEEASCNVTRVNPERPVQAMTFKVWEPDAGWLTLFDHGWAEASPAVLPLVLSVDGEALALDWMVVGRAVDAPVDAVETMGRLAERLATGSVLRLAGADGAGLVDMDLGGNAAAFAGLRDCVATRLDVAAE